jgi:hypothetical protein
MRTTCGKPINYPAWLKHPIQLSSSWGPFTFLFEKPVYRGLAEGYPGNLKHPTPVQAAAQFLHVPTAACRGAGPMQLLINDANILIDIELAGFTAILFSPPFTCCTPDLLFHDKLGDEYTFLSPYPC